MKDQYQVVVIGGGIVGCSVLFHLTLCGMTDVALIEREELTAGSTWHAAGGFHAMNADTRIAELQKYTIGLYPQIEEESGQSVGLHMSGGMELAGTSERWQWLKSELRWLRTQDTDASLLTPDEAAELVPIIDPTGLYGALFDPLEGNLDPNGATQAYAGAARTRGAEVIQHNRVLALTGQASGAWRVETEQGEVVAEHVVNAAGLWARRVGAMVGVDHPLVPMPHHYLVTAEVPQVAAIEGDMPAVTDLEGFTYLQKEGRVCCSACTSGTRATGRSKVRTGTSAGPCSPRARPHHARALDRLPALPRARGHRHPPMGERRLHVHAGRQPARRPRGRHPELLGGMRVHGQILAVRRHRPRRRELDRRRRPRLRRVRHGRRALRPLRHERPLPARDDGAVLLATLRHGLSERGAAGRPAPKTTTCYDELLAAGARFTVNWGLEVPLYFAPSPDFEELDTLGRSNAEPIVGEEVEAVRTAAGAYEIAQYARYEVHGPEAEAWLDHVLASRLPEVAIRLAPMLNEAGRLMGDLTVARLEDDRFWLTGSYYLQDWHLRWFRAHLPAGGVRSRTSPTRGWASQSPARHRARSWASSPTTTSRTRPSGSSTCGRWTSAPRGRWSAASR